jgi:hypothetical protein
MKQLSEHTGSQNPGEQKPGREHEAGHGSSMPPAASGPHAAPSAQKAQGAAAHPGRPEEKKNEER